MIIPEDNEVSCVKFQPSKSNPVLSIAKYFNLPLNETYCYADLVVNTQETRYWHIQANRVLYDMLSPVEMDELHRLLKENLVQR